MKLLAISKNLNAHQCLYKWDTNKNSKIWENNKMFVNIVQGYCVKTSGWLACKNIQGMQCNVHGRI